MKTNIYKKMQKKISFYGGNSSVLKKIIKKKINKIIRCQKIEIDADDFLENEIS